MKIIILLVSILMLLTNLSFAQLIIPGSFEFEGDTRHYNVYLPPNYESNLPVILALHGYSWSITEFANYTMMHEYADTSDFIVVYPEGSFYNQSSGWNSGLRSIGFGQVDTTSNDVGFISALIDTLKSHYDIDLTRVYSCGYSQGGEMTYRLFIELGNRFAAVASVAGKLNSVSGTIGFPLRPVPVMHFHGTLDGIELWGPGADNLWSVEATLNFWIQNNNCVLTPDTIAIPDTCISDSCTVQKIIYTNCADSTQVILYKILRGGHTWPGADTSIWAGGGFLNRDINASQEIVNFFKNYTNPLVDIAWTKNAEIIHTGYDPYQSDTLFVKAYTANPQNHSISVIAKILGASTAYTDSVILYDDGMHGDENPNDDIWGNFKVLTTYPEDKYYVDIYTNDLIEGTSQKYRKLNYYFLRIGPVILDYYSIIGDTIIGPGEYGPFEFALKNESAVATATNITSHVVSLDSFSTIWILNTIAYDSIPAGASVTGSPRQYLAFSDSCTHGQQVRFAMDIFYNGLKFWSDTFSVIISGLEKEDKTFPLSFDLKQNYPNPFNPRTNIPFSIPKTEIVTLKIYNLLGQEVITLVSEKLKSGTYQYTWDAGSLSSGVYFYELKAGNYVKSQKMILLK